MILFSRAYFCEEEVVRPFLVFLTYDGVKNTSILYRWQDEGRFHSVFLQGDASYATIQTDICLKQDVLDYKRGITWLCNDHVFWTMLYYGVLDLKDYPKFYADNWGDKDGVPPSRPFKTVEEIIALIREAGGIALVAHPHEQLQYIDTLMEMGLEGLEAWHPDLLPEEKVQAYQLALEKGLYISGGSDHSGLCGGQYRYYERPEECEYYLPPCSVGTTYEYYMEIKSRKINR